MKISAFTLIGNAIKYDYPVLESIHSLLPFVDEYIVNINSDSEDDTKRLILDEFAGDEKVVPFLSKWEKKDKGTSFFYRQTNHALEMCSHPWAFYLQADECIHESQGDMIHSLVGQAEESGKLAITMNYFHFEKHPSMIRKDYTDGCDAYDKEIRLIKNNGSLVSWGDAQSFCLTTDMNQPAMHHKEILLDSDMNIYHYGYLKTPETMLQKKLYLADFYNISHPDRKEEIKSIDGKYIFSNNLKPFSGTHPSVMRHRLSAWE